MPTYLYPEDRTGVATSNKITAELHSITFSADVDFHFIVPTFAPFFADGFRLVRVVAGNRIPLVVGKDYHLGLQMMSISASVAKQVYGAVVLLNVSEDTLYEIESYQTVGGSWTLDTTGMTELISNIIKNPRSLSWEQVNNFPQIFNPTDHLWNYADMVGQTEVVQALVSIANAIASRAVAGNNHHLLKGNPHDTSKFDFGLDLVPNAPIASLPGAVAGTDNMSLISPMLLKQVLQAMGLVDLSNLANAMREHIEDNQNPHLNNSASVGLGEVINLPLASTQDVLRNLSVDKYMTLATLKLWFSMHGGLLSESTKAPIPQGSLLQSYCTSDKDRMGVYADGRGGTYESIIQVRDVDCGYAAQTPIAHPPKGTVLQTYCSGETLMHLVANGSGGVTSTVGEVNSSTCTAGNYPPSGTVISTTCEGTTLVRTISNGSGGVTIERTEESSQCNVNTNPVRGTLLSFQCVGFNMVGKYADGNGGFYEGVIERNSAECGFVVVTASPQPTFTPAGTVLGTSCAGYNLQDIIANGAGGQYTVTKVVNSLDCGYSPTNAPTTSPTTSPTRPPVTPPPTLGRLTYSSTLTNIYRGDTETHTVIYTGWKPYTTYSFEVWGRSSAWGTPYERVLETWTITTDGNGGGQYQTTKQDTGIVPVGRYESWMRDISTGRVSNTLTRIFRGDR